MQTEGEMLVWQGVPTCPFGPSVIFTDGCRVEESSRCAKCRSRR